MNEGNNNTKVKDFSDEVKGIAGSEGKIPKHFKTYIVQY